MIGAVDSIASPWHVDDNGIVIISQSKAKSAVVLIQMISEAIRFHTVLDTLAGLDVFCSTEPNLHRQIWVDQNRWSQIGKDIFKNLRALHGIEEDVPKDKEGLEALEELMNNHELVYVIMRYFYFCSYSVANFYLN
ncbi:hypothetical protein DM860_010046 [Cuscuta australis]|uniref:rRNA N-glycosylase n=1 Tax=Cuscuta australis TaxID=267555 RepID=A0A328D5V5_9ASTE|nr:hypothetical protein DM860_010046 [Cuscuta australis]